MTELSPSEVDLLARVDSWLESHREEIIADIIDWVAIPSVRTEGTGPGEPFGVEVRRILDRAVARASELGFETADVDGYAVTVLADGQPGQPEIGLASHLDVVPAGDNWTVEPYAPFERDGFVIGRGASDNKGPAVIDLYLLRAFRELEIPLTRRLRIIYGGAEESGMEDLAYYAEHGPVPQISLVTDGPFPVNFAQKGGLNPRLFIPAGPRLSTLSAGVAENAVPATATIALTGVGVAELETAIAALTDVELRETLSVQGDDAGAVLHARGQSGHAAFPDGTRNAILLLARGLLALDLTVNGTELLDAADRAAAGALARILETPYGHGAGTDRDDEISGVLTQNGGIVRPHEGGIALHLDIRYPVTVDSADLLAALAAAVAPVGGHVLGHTDAAPFHIARDHEIVTLLQDTFNTVLGVTAEPFAMGGGTHSRVLPNAITFGPGLGRIPGVLPEDHPVRRPDFIPAENGTPHGPDEFVSIENLFTAFRIYVIALTRLDRALGDA
ncbi:M20 family peptidase [Mycetocola tolaasinivorans]|uniref:M20 family peptidase n=1 Tax=Mycetocola tolaasinivorans TaxID=76635 RepID=A0A3L7A756_9MICO|nr:Sapep family Mn(2+)-dependent dipeptidase [Mycetocola tolaasinivorans]RLP75670.1 M20 family peptidase [Mycetocola tolaasinivorans]